MNVYIKYIYIFIYIHIFLPFTVNYYVRPGEINMTEIRALFEGVGNSEAVLLPPTPLLVMRVSKESFNSFHCFLPNNSFIGLNEYISNLIILNNGSIEFIFVWNLTNWN